MSNKDDEVVFETKYEALEVDGGIVTLDGNTVDSEEDFWALNPELVKWFREESSGGGVVDVDVDPVDLFIASTMLCIIAIGYAFPWIAVGSLVSREEYCCHPPNQ
jgi:hypothetical protein